ncbi:MAG: ExbD/TolR family protein [Planctomycetota bacterium]
MFASVQTRRRTGLGAAAVDVAPLIDMVFILLVFFIATSTFVKETGIAVERPHAATSGALPDTSLRISLTASGDLFTGGRRVEPRELESEIRSFVASEPRATMVLIADRATPSGRLVEIMDLARGAGASDIAIATSEVDE